MNPSNLVIPRDRPFLVAEDEESPQFVENIHRLPVQSSRGGSSAPKERRPPQELDELLVSVEQSRPSGSEGLLPAVCAPRTSSVPSTLDPAQSGIDTVAGGNAPGKRAPPRSDPDRVESGRCQTGLVSCGPWQCDPFRVGERASPFPGPLSVSRRTTILCPCRAWKSYPSVLLRDARFWLRG
jgi:hypothetical protein